LRRRGRSKLLSGNAEIQPYRYWGPLGFLWPWREAHQQPRWRRMYRPKTLGRGLLSVKKKSRTLAWRRSMSSTRKTNLNLTKTSYYLQRVAVAEGEVVASVGEEAVASVGEEAVASVGEEAVASAEGREAVASAEGAAAKGVVAAEGVVAEAYGLEPA
jgi:hypothetical protein